MGYRILCCDSCRATTVDSGEAGSWFVFNDAGTVSGNARCPECLPDQADLLRLPDLNWL